MKKAFIFPLLLIFIIIFFFSPFFFQGKLPIPADTIIGLYHPFRDLYAKDYPNGIPYKNFLITDPVRQQYPWRWLALNIEKKGELPLWNPYNMAGMPLLASLQAAAFYPLNFLLLLFPFFLSWSILIFLQQILAGIFLYFYLRNLKLEQLASFLGALTYGFSGFFIAWLEWGTIGHVALWLPLILLSIDKIFSRTLPLRGTKQSRENLFKRRGIYPNGIATLLSVARNDVLIWSLVFIFSLTSSFFAGHLQTFFYMLVVSATYFFARWFQFGRSGKVLRLFLILNSCFLILTAIQWMPLWQFIELSARNIDQIDWQKEGWFIPWQHVIQFIVPDFFGNPTTLNYWGVWNYGEFIGYVGIIPLMLALFALFFRHDKKTFFFGIVFFLSLIFSLPTIFAQLPYILHIPFLSTAQPTRLLFLTDFSLAVLSALGFDAYKRLHNKRKILYILIFIASLFVALWYVVFFGNKIIPNIQPPSIVVAKRNLYFPTFVFGLGAVAFLITVFSKKKNVQQVFYYFFILIIVMDLLRFSQKFTPFSQREYLFPQTKSLEYLQKQDGQFRTITTDNRILPPNFSVMYHLQTLDGYDPLYLRRYGELIAAIERNKPDIHPPFGFNRIITPQNHNSRLIDLLGVKYILSLNDLLSPKLVKVFTEGQTKIYRNTEAYPRAFFVQTIKHVQNKQAAIHALFDEKIDLKQTAIVESDKPINKKSFSQGTATITEYAPNNITIRSENNKEGYLVLMDTYYPAWHAKICSVEETNCSETTIYITNYHFRGIILPPGKHTVIFYITLL